MDVIVIGAGIIGSSIAWHVAEMGATVGVVDQYGAGARRGSSHGATRGLRYSYEDPAYARLAMEAETWWRVTERRSGQRLLRMTGGVDIGVVGSPSFDATVQTVADLALEHRLIGGSDLACEFPWISVPDGYSGLVQTGAGLLDADTALSTIRALAGDAGATFQWETAVERVRRDDAGWELDIGRADAPIRAHRVALAAGPWTSGLIERSPDLSLPVLPPIAVLQCEPIYVELARPLDATPLFYIHPDAEYADGLYVQPQPGTRDAGTRLLKIGRHGGAGHLDPTNPLPGPIEDHGPMVDRLAQFVPAVEGGRVRGFDTCFYSTTPDDGFIIDSIGGGLFLAAGFSGHGFKFAPVIGRAAAELLLEGETAYEVDGMTLSRFAV